MPPMADRFAFTGEPRYADADPALRAEMSRWRAALDPAVLRGLVERLPAPRSRLHAPEAMAATDALIERVWRAAGWQVERQELHLDAVAGGLDTEPRYTPHVYPHLDGVNIVGALPGDTTEAIVVVAHHDTVKDAPGADDNGAGVVALLELARLLAGKRFRRTVVLAAPDFEEIGLIGSRELVPWLRARYDVRAAIVFDPIGYFDPGPDVQRVPPGVDRLYPGQSRRLAARRNAGDSVVAIYRRVSMPLVREWARALSAAVGRDRVLLLRDPVDLPIVGPLARRVPAARNFSRSDHVPFWRAGLPAIHVTNTGNFRNPNYHRPTDTAETLDYATLADIIATTGVVIERLAGAPTAWTATA